MASRVTRFLVGEPAPVRDPLLDNARYLVLLLVIAGHALAPLRGSMDGVFAGYVWLYAFHMPLFVLLSGYTARSYRGEPRQVRRMVGSLVWPFLLIGSLLEVQVNLFRQQDPLSEFSVLEPLWLTWFVAALFLWRLTNPIWTALRFPVTVAVLVSLLGGLAPIPDFIGLPQVVALLPFYVLGLTGIRRSHLDQLTRVWVRLVALAVLVGLLVVAWRRPPEWNTNWLYFRDGYGEPALGAGALEGIATRSALLALALVMSFAVLALVPQRRRWFTSLGENTLYAYLLHGFVIKWAVYEGWVQEVIPYGLAGAAVVVALCAVLGTVLMSRPVATLFRPVFEPQLRWLFRAEDTAQPDRSGERRPVVQPQ